MTPPQAAGHQKDDSHFFSRQAAGNAPPRGFSGRAGAWFWPGAVFLLAAAVLATLPFALHNWSLMDADHGVVGLMARHIAQGRHFPIYVYGQGYVGAPEIYWVALFFVFLPATPLTLGLAMLALMVLYLVCAAVLIRRGAGPAGSQSGAGDGPGGRG